MTRGILFFAVCSLISCNGPVENGPYIFVIPDYFPALPPEPERNRTTNNGVELGRMLFFDPILSGSNTISCASCHIPEKAFSDGGKRFSNIGKLPLLRNTPPLFNLAWMTGLFWDGGVRNLESVSLAPLIGEHEMGQDLRELVTELESDKQYKEQFNRAFGSDSIYSALILRALAQYQRTLISANSKYDQVMKGAVFFSDEEMEGRKLVIDKCGSCHQEPLFTDNQYHNNGLDTGISDHGPLDIFLGRARITREGKDFLSYKTPSLRNLKYTSPYMHDGRFESLQAVLDFYSSGVQMSQSLDTMLLNSSGVNGIELNDQQKKSILAFLATLNDPIFVKSDN